MIEGVQKMKKHNIHHFRLTGLPENRRLAIEVGVEFYYTGKKCKFGHISKRLSKNGHCFSCAQESKPKYFNLSNCGSVDYKLAVKIFKYDPATGLLTWRVDTRGSVVGGKVGTAIVSNSGKSYIHLTIGAQKLLAHRVAWLIYTGMWPDGLIDHLNGDGLDNRLVNMREASSLDNSRNMRLSSRNKSGKSGVGKRSGCNYWYSEIGVQGRTISLGSFQKIECAIKARKDAEIKYGFHKNHGKNRPL